ncbi:Uma2 family endonuclease [Calothrix rhizosoleniae]|uniref:Uma2 family endonuclease n=1 Tax=Calothrix rhizosoleniae TaxID=888997 RepID=UPI000B49E359|nr:Uma2 family endonuclease [Calothrix rhizosoleniae]
MTRAITKPISFEEFIEWYPNNGMRYELHKGIIVEMPPPTGDHENVIGFLVEKITIEYVHLGLPYRIPKTGLVKTPDNDSTYSPDILLVNHDHLVHEPLCNYLSTLIQAASIPLVVEVVSTNWRDDYHDKFGDYEEMGIAEYWIVDYTALSGKRFTGDPKQPTITICELVDGEYQITQFKGNSPIVSPLFPHLNLTAQKIFDSAL